MGCLSDGDGRPGELALCLSRSKLRNREVEGDLGGGIAIVLAVVVVYKGLTAIIDKGNVKDNPDISDQLI